MAPADPRSLKTNGSLDVQVGSIQDVGTFAGVEQKLGFWSAVFSLAISMIGAGVVASPFAIAACGYIVGPAVLVMICVLSYFSYTMLVNCTRSGVVSSWGDLLAKYLSPAWVMYANVSLVLMLNLALSAYLVISGNVIRSATSILTPPAVLMTDGVLFAILLLIMLPFVLAKSLQGLAKLANVCTVALFAVVALIIFECIRVCRMGFPYSQAGPTPKMQAPLVAVPIFASACFGHMNMSQIYAEMKPGLKPVAHKVVFAAILGAAVIYMSIGMMGYMAFGSSVNSDVVLQLAASGAASADSWLPSWVVVAVIHTCLAMFLILKCPLLVLPTRSIVLGLLGQNAADVSQKMHVSATLGVLGVAYAGAILLPQLSLILGVLGATVVIPMCFIVPPRLAWEHEVPRRTGLCIVVAVVGFLATALSLVQCAYDLADHFGARPAR